MQEKLRENKPTVIVLSGALLIIILVLLLFIPLRQQEEKSSKRYFPNYENITINEKVVKNKKKYNKVVEQLENDETFNKLLMINDYDSSNASKKDLENMLTNYILLYTIENTRTMREINVDTGIFCLKEDYLVTSFKDLYNTDITKYSSSIIYYFEHAFKKGNEYCFYYDNIKKKYGKSIITSIDTLTYKDKVITVDAYVYSFKDSTQTNKIDSIKKELENKNYSTASNITINELNGEANKKRINFKIFNNGKYFKFQVIDIKTLE